MKFCGGCGAGLDPGARFCGGCGAAVQGSAPEAAGVPAAPVTKVLQPAERTLGVGRDPASDVVVDRDGVSWHHARLQLRAGTWMLTDLESTNGTWVNGERIDGSVELAPGDALRLGSHPVDLDLERLAQASRPPPTTDPPARQSTPPKTTGHRYDGFISYKHGVSDALAEAMERELGRFAKSLFQVRALDLFLDKGQLNAASDLRERLELALADSAQLVVLACPEWAASKWCRAELEWWLEHHGTEGLVLVVQGGDIVWGQGDFDWARTTALPRSVAGRFTGEPLWIDARGLSLLNMEDPRFRRMLVTLASTLHGTTVDEIDGQAHREHRRTLRIRNMTVALVVALVAAGLGGGTLLRSDLFESEAERAGQTLLKDARRVESSRPSEGLRLAREARQYAVDNQIDLTEYDALLIQAFNLPLALEQTGPFVAAPALGTAVDPSGIQCEGMADLEAQHGEALRARCPEGQDCDVEGQVLGQLVANGQLELVQVRGDADAEFVFVCQDGARIQTLVAPRPSRAAVAPDGDLIVYNGFLTGVSWSEVGDEKEVHGHNHHPLGSLTALSVSPDGRYIASGDSKGRVVLIDLEPVRVSSHEPDPDPITRFDWAKQPVEALTFSSDGSLLQVDYPGTSSRLLSTQSRLPTLHLDGAAFSGGPSGGTVTLWDGRTLQLSPDPPDPPRGAAWADYTVSLELGGVVSGADLLVKLDRGEEEDDDDRVLLRSADGGVVVVLSSEVSLQRIVLLDPALILSYLDSQVDLTRGRAGP